MIQTLFGILEEEKKTGFFDRMKQAVTRTRENLAERIDGAPLQGQRRGFNPADYATTRAPKRRSPFSR